MFTIRQSKYLTEYITLEWFHVSSLLVAFVVETDKAVEVVEAVDSTGTFHQTLS